MLCYANYIQILTPMNNLSHIILGKYKHKSNQGNKKQQWTGQSFMMGQPQINYNRMNIFVNHNQKTIVFTDKQVRELIQQASSQENDWFYVSEGKACSPSTIFRNNQNVYIYPKMRGGKGGFGAKLKTEGGKKVRPNQNMFSKDLQGQPVEYSTINKQYEEFYKKKMEQNQKVEKELAQFQIVSNTYRQNYTSNKLDSTYNAEMQENEQRLKNSMKVGMKKYLEKKREQKIQETKKQEGEKIEINELFEQDVVNQGQVKKEQQKQEQKVKQRQCTHEKQTEQRLGQPKKRLKLSIQQQQGTEVKTSSLGLMSARDKLKSLFKK